MKYFTVGPIEMDQETLQVTSKQLPYFRNDEFSQIMFENEQMFKKSVNATNDSKAIFLTGSGTSAMDAVVGHCASGSKVLVINGGSFGQRFCDLCAFYGVDYDEIKVALEDDLTLNHFEGLNLDSYDLLLVNMHETSCGKLYDLKMLGSLCQQHDISLVVDAISSYLADPIDVQEMNIACLITSSHKALGLEPGIAMMLFTPSFIEQFIENKRSHNYYLDLKAHLKNMERGQTPFTPAISVCLALNEKLKRIDPVAKIAHTKHLAQYFRDIINYNPPKYQMSNALTMLRFERGNAKDVYRKLLAKGVCLNPCGQNLADTALRVSHMGALDEQDYNQLKQLLEEVNV